jgi:hypothetical protein
MLADDIERVVEALNLDVRRRTPRKLICMSPFAPDRPKLEVEISPIRASGTTGARGASATPWAWWAMPRPQADPKSKPALTEGIRWAQDYFGIAKRGFDREAWACAQGPAKARAEVRGRRRGASSPSTARRRNGLWLAAEPSSRARRPGTTWARGIDLTQLPRLPGSVRVSDRQPWRDEGEVRHVGPCLMSAMNLPWTASSARLHRIWIDPAPRARRRTCRKSPTGRRCARCGRAPRAAPSGCGAARADVGGEARAGHIEDLVVCEGVEDGLSASPWVGPDLHARRSRRSPAWARTGGPTSTLAARPAGRLEDSEHGQAHIEGLWAPKIGPLHRAFPQFDQSNRFKGFQAQYARAAMMAACGSRACSTPTSGCAAWAAGRTTTASWCSTWATGAGRRQGTRPARSGLRLPRPAGHAAADLGRQGRLRDDLQRVQRWNYERGEVDARLLLGQAGRRRPGRRHRLAAHGVHDRRRRHRQVHPAAAVRQLLPDRIISTVDATEAALRACSARTRDGQLRRDRGRRPQRQGPGGDEAGPDLGQRRRRAPQFGRPGCAASPCAARSCSRPSSRPRCASRTCSGSPSCG